MLQIMHKLLSLKYFYELSGKWIPWLAVITGALFLYGLVDGLLVAPADYQQGDGYRIIFLHVPCATLSLVIYVSLAVCALMFLVWKIKLADVVAKVVAPIGALFTGLALITGAIWGKPMWGTWWIWDARLTSELILLVIYFGLIGLRQSIPDPTAAAKATSILTLVGVVDIPIIHYSVNWWNTLHQGASLSLFKSPQIAPTMLIPLLIMMLAFASYALLITLLKVRHEILEREHHSTWVQNLVSD